MLRLQLLTLHSLLHLLRLPWQFLQPSLLLLRRRVAPSPSRALSSPVVWFSGEDNDFVAIHLPSAHPSASASIQRLLVSPVLPLDSWVHPKTPATVVTDQASSNTCICSELTINSPSLGGCDHPPNLKYLNQVHRLSATPNNHEKQLRLQKRRLLRYVRCNRSSHRMRICWMVAFPSIAPWRATS